MTGRDGRRGRRLRLLAACAALLPAIAACGIQPSGITSLGAAPAAAQATPQAVGPVAIGSNQYLLFFYQNNRLTPVYRPAAGKITESYVLTALLNGPTIEEKAEGFTSALPLKLAATPNAQNERYAFSLSAPLGARARTEFICTMQYFDGTDSIGVETAGLPQTMIWTGCADTTSQYVPMQGSTAASAVPAPTN